MSMFEAYFKLLRILLLALNESQHVQACLRHNRECQQTLYQDRLALQAFTQLQNKTDLYQNPSFQFDLIQISVSREVFKDVHVLQSITHFKHTQGDSIRTLYCTMNCKHEYHGQHKQLSNISEWVLYTPPPSQLSSQIQQYAPTYVQQSHRTLCSSLFLIYRYIVGIHSYVSQKILRNSTVLLLPISLMSALFIVASTAQVIYRLFSYYWWRHARGYPPRYEKQFQHLRAGDWADP